jgi:hypothetical protein
MSVARALTGGQCMLLQIYSPYNKKKHARIEHLILYHFLYHTHAGNVTSLISQRANRVLRVGLGNPV